MKIPVVKIRIRSLAPKVAFVAVALLFLIPADVLAQEGTGGTVVRPRQPQDPSRPAKIDDLTVEQILNVRDRLGGGVGSILSGVDLGSEGDMKKLLRKEFEEELMRLSRESAARGGERSDAKANNALRDPASTPRNPWSQIQNTVVRPINAPLARPPVAAGQLGEKGRELREREKHVFRQVARHLEELAWEMEEIDAYGEADRLRELSASMRMRVRNHPRSEASPNHPGGAPPRRR